MTSVDKEGIRAAYQNVRDDGTEINWCIMKYDGNTISVSNEGEEYDEFSNQFTDDDRGFAYIRVFTGDEMSKRAKFALVTWIGQHVSPLKKAKMSTDKAFVKDVIQDFAVEILSSEIEEISLESIAERLRKVGGANYGTGVRD